MNNSTLDISNIPFELKLIVEIIKVDNKVIDLKDDLEEIDWELFIQLSIHHWVYPMLYSKLLNNVCDIIPKTVIQTLAINYRNNVFKMLHLSGVMDQLSRLFVGNDVQSLFLKGPILARDLYGDISLRTCSDLDILVPFDNLEKANELLLNLGYVKDEYIKTLLNDWKWRHHHFTYYHPTEGTKIEIHWRLNPHPNIEPSFSELWERKRVSTISNSPTYYLGKEDLFLNLVMHGARHGWSRLRWLEDIDRLVKKELDWSIIQNLFKKYQCAHIGGQSLILAEEILNLTLTSEMNSLVNRRRSKKLANDAIFYLGRMVNLHSGTVPKDIAIYHSNHLISLLSSQQKLIH